MSLSLHTQYQRKPGLIQTEIDGEVVMMSVEQGEYYGLDAIGAQIWQCLEQPATIAQLCDRLLRDFDVSSEECMRDVRVFIDELLKNQLIERVAD